MNLIIDVGNTFVKFAVFQNNRLIYKKSVKTTEILKTFKEFLVKYQNITNTIISNVGKLDSNVLTEFKSNSDVLILDKDTKLPFKNLYETPKTLGVDRIALVSAAVKQYQYNNVLVIDAGTCITYDFVTKDADYLGGAISPGVRLRYRSLNNHTANLPLLDTEMPKQIIGTSTASSIHSGVVFGILKEIDGVIDDYLEKYTDLTVILTGGDSNFLSKQLKNSIFANSNFILEGLNFILEYNTH